MSLDDVDAVAVLVSVAATCGVTSMLAVTVSLEIRSPKEQTTVLLLRTDEPIESEADWKFKLAASGSVTTEPSALPGPRLVTLTVKVRLLPVVAAAGSPTRPTARSAKGSVLLAEITTVLFAELRSMSLDATAAVTAAAPALVTLATRVIVAVPFVPNVPRLLTATLPFVEVTPDDDAADWSTRPAERVFVTTTPFAAFGPRFVTVIVQVELSPTSPGLGNTTPATLRSAMLLTGVMRLMPRDQPEATVPASPVARSTM